MGYACKQPALGEILAALNADWGGATCLFLQGVPLEDIRKYGRWKTTAVNIYLYFDDVVFRGVGKFFVPGQGVLDQLQMLQEKGDTARTSSKYVHLQQNVDIARGEAFAEPSYMCGGRFKDRVVTGTQDYSPSARSSSMSSPVRQQVKTEVKEEKNINTVRRKPKREVKKKEEDHKEDKEEDQEEEFSHSVVDSDIVGEETERRRKVRRSIRDEHEAGAWGEDSQSHTAEIDSEDERRKRARRNCATNDGASIWDNMSFISTEEHRLTLAKILCEDVTDDSFVTPVEAESNEDPLSTSDEDDSQGRVRDTGLFSGDEEVSRAPTSYRKVGEASGSADMRPPRLVFNTHSPSSKGGPASSSRPSGKGFRRDRKGEGKTGEKGVLKKVKQKGCSNKDGESTHQRRVGNLAFYTHDRLIWGRVSNYKRMRPGDDYNPCAAQHEEVVKMVTRGETYLNNFIQFDGHREAMAVWRSRVKMEEKTGTSNAPDSVTREFRRAIDRYQNHWTDLHASSGRGNRRKNVRPKSKLNEKSPSRNKKSKSPGFRTASPSEATSRRVAAAKRASRPKRSAW